MILASGNCHNVTFGNLDRALATSDTQLRLFGKPEVAGSRRMGVALARADTIEQARAAANTCADAVDISL